jgi:hypothetical protein
MYKEFNALVVSIGALIAVQQSRYIRSGEENGLAMLLRRRECAKIFANEPRLGVTRRG